jgi:hypothetical protein
MFIGHTLTSVVSKLDEDREYHFLFPEKMETDEALKLV